MRRKSLLRSTLAVLAIGVPLTASQAAPAPLPKRLPLPARCVSSGDALVSACPYQSIVDLVGNCIRLPEALMTATGCCLNDGYVWGQWEIHTSYRCEEATCEVRSQFFGLNAACSERYPDKAPPKLTSFDPEAGDDDDFQTETAIIEGIEEMGEVLSTEGSDGESELLRLLVPETAP